MKKLIIIAALLTAFTAAQAQTPATAATEVKTEKATEPKTPATNDATAKKEDDSSAFVGTNDFYLSLVREGVKKG